MSKYLQILGLGAVAVLSAVSAQASTIYGSNVGGYYPGIYSFPTEGEIPEKVFQYNGMESKIGAVFTPEAFYGISASSSYSRYCYKLSHNTDLTEWEVLPRVNEKLAQKDIASALGYNPFTATVYGSFTDAEDSSKYNFGIFSEATATSTVIAPLAKKLVSIATDSDGKMFAVDADGDFCSLSLSGEVEVIGATGVTPSASYACGMAFDPSTGILYWTPINKSTDSALYTIDVATGAATKVYDFAYNTNFTALAFAPEEVAAGAPADVEDFTAEAQGVQNVLNISFKLPSKTVGGEDMMGAVKYKVYLDGEVIADTQGAPGAEVTLTETPEAGSHVVVVAVANAAGNGNKAIARVYVGADAPGEVQDLEWKVEDKTITINWSAPVAGANGGNFDAENLVYDVFCVTTEETVASDLTATTFSVTLNPEGLTVYRYTVTAKCGDLKGPAVETGNMTVGDGMVPPYSQTFDDADNFDEIFFSTYDANNDGKGWSLYSGWSNSTARYTYSSTNDADDWLFTCPLQLKGGQSYELSFKLSCGSWGNGETLEVKYGKLPNVDSMTEVVMESTDFQKGFNDVTSSVFTPSENGTYYLGIHITSGADSYNVDLDNLEIKEVEGSAVEGVASENISVRGMDGKVVIELNNASDVEVVDMNGRKILSANLAGGSYEVPLASGLHVVSVNGKAVKVIVR